MNQQLIDCYRWHRQHSYRAKATTLITRAREDVAANTKRYPRTGIYAWRSDGCWQEPTPRYGSPAYYCDDWPAGWRNLGNAGEIRSDSAYRGRYVDHTGWFTDDDFQDDTIAGYVLQLPARNGKPLYIPGTAQSGCCGVTLYPLDQFDDIGECARAADRYAEIAAEHERDYNRARQAGSNAADYNNIAKDTRREIITVCRDLREARRLVSPYGATADAVERLCGIARRKVQCLLDDLYKARRDRDELRDNYGDDPAFVERYGE